MACKQKEGGEYSSSEGEFSDTEDDRRPCFKKVYNHTKVFEKRKLDGTLVDNKVRISTLSLGTLKGEVEELKTVTGYSAATTILCVGLRLNGQKEILKKFIFTNQFEYENETFNSFSFEFMQKLHERNYHLIQAQHSHAEMSFLQFLDKRKNKYQVDKHFLASDRESCGVCSLVLEKIFGDTLLTTSIERYDRFYVPPALERIVKDIDGLRIEPTPPPYYWLSNEFTHSNCAEARKLRKKYPKAIRKLRAGDAIRDVIDESELSLYNILYLTRIIANERQTYCILTELDDWLRRVKKGQILSEITSFEQYLRDLDIFRDLIQQERDLFDNFTELEYQEILARTMLVWRRKRAQTWTPDQVPTAVDMETFQKIDLI